MADAALSLLIKARNETDAAFRSLRSSSLGVAKDATTMRIAIIEATKRADRLALTAKATGRELDQLRARKAANELKALERSASSSDSKLKALHGTLNTVGRVGFTILGAGVGVAAAGLAKFTQEAAAEQANIARLQTALGHLSAADRAQAAGVEQVIAKREQLAFADDALRDSLALLVTQTGSYSDSLNRQKIAMDVSRGTGIDLQTSSRLLGKINEETTNTFARYGIVIRKGATETEALAAIQSRFSGQSEAYANTAAGKWDIVRIKFADIREDIGALLLPTVQRLTAALADFLTRHEKDIESMARVIKEDLTKGFEMAHRAAQPFIDAFNKLPDRDKVAVVTALAAVIGGALVSAMLAYAAASLAASLSNPFTAIVVGVTLAVAAIVLLVRHWDAVWAGMKAAPAAILDWLQGHWVDVLVGIFFGLPGLLIKHWGDIFDKMPGPVQTAMNFVAGIVSKTINFIIDALNKLTSKLNDIKNFGGTLNPFSHVPDIPEIPNVGDFQQQASANGPAQIFGGMDAWQAFRIGAKASEDAARSLGDTLGGGDFSGGGGVAGAAAKADQGLIELALAFADFHARTNGSVQDFLVLIKLTQDKAALDQRARQAGIDLAAAQLEAADAGFQLRKGLVDVAEYMVKTGATITEVFRDAARKARDSIQSAFGDLFSRPTRESAEMQLRIDQLQKQRDEAELHGANEEELKRIDEKIQRLQLENRLREDNIKILQDQMVLADKMLLTDEQQLFAAQLYIIAMANQSEQLKALTDQAGLEAIYRYNMMNAMNEYAAALRSGVSGGSAVPAYASGTPFVPVTGLAIVHRGERIIPADQNRAGGGGNTYHVYIQNWVNQGDAQAGLSALGASY